MNNQYIFANEKIVYSCSIKIDALGFNSLLESIFCLLLVVEAIFPAKSLWDVWRAGSRLARGQVDVGNEAKHLSPMCFWSIGGVTCSWVLLWTGPFLLPNAGCRHCSFWCISCVWWASSLAVMIFPGFRKLRWVRLAAEHLRLTMISYKTPALVSQPNPIQKWFIVV